MHFKSVEKELLNKIFQNNCFSISNKKINVDTCTHIIRLNKLQGYCNNKARKEPEKENFICIAIWCEDRFCKHSVKIETLRKILIDLTT